MSEKILKATHWGKWIIDKENDLFIECYVTEDKKRLLSLRGTARSIGLKGAGSTALVRSLNSQWIEPYLSEDLKEWLKTAQSENPKIYEGPRGRTFISFEAELFVDLCNAYIQADNNGLFEGPQWLKQKLLATKLLKIMSAFAKIGIIALIDEITGYQYDRDQDELQKILAQYISPELLPWTKRFPDEFYKQLFRLMKWQYSPLSVKRPGYVGTLTNDLIYKQLPPGVLDELREKNPPVKPGRRKYKLFQFLTDDIGNPHLEKQLAIVTTLMRISPTWRKFKELFERAFNPSEQEKFSFMEQDED